MKIIGILGGMGSLSTVDFFNKIVNQTQAQNDQEHIHLLINNCAFIPDRTDYILNQTTDPTPFLIQEALRLEKAGVDCLAMSCNTAHYFYDRIKAELNIPFLNMIEETLQSVLAQKTNIKKVGLLATYGTYLSQVYENVFSKQGIEVLTPLESMKQKLMKIIYAFKAGKTDVSLTALVDSVSYLTSKGAETIILGCTELSMLVTSFKMQEISILMTNFKMQECLIDPTIILAHSVIRFAKEL